MHRLLRLGLVVGAFSAFACSTTQANPVADAGTTIDSSADDGSLDGGGADAVAQKAPLILVDFGVFLQVTLGGKGPFLLRYDTGSPSTYLDKAHANAAGLGSGGVHEAKLGNDVVIGSGMVTLIDWLEAGSTYPGLPGPILGLAGNDLFKGNAIAVGLNYRDSEIWLVRAPKRDAMLPTPSGVGSRVSADFRLTQGYLAVLCSFQGGGGTPDQQCLFDTGAINAFAFEQHWSTFSHPDDLHRVPVISHDNQGNLLEGYFQRATAVRMGDLSVRGDTVSVMSKFELLTSVGKSAGLNLVGMVGMTSTLGHYTVIDYPNERLHFFPYEPSKSLFTSPFIGFGFTVGSSGANGSVVVSAIVPLSDAAEKNAVQVGDKLVRVDGVPLSSATLSYTIATLIAGSPGQHRVFEFDRAGVTVSADLTARDLLPPVPQ